MLKEKILLCLVAQQSVVHHCISDKIQKHFVPQEAKSLLRSAPNSEKNPIRIYFDTSSLHDDTAEGICREEGQRVEWIEGRIRCSDTDLLTDSKIKSIEGTLTEVKKFFEQSLRVNSLSNNITLLPTIRELKVPFSTYSTDMFVSVTVRPYPTDSTTLAAASYVLTENSQKRPIQGVIYINPSKIPSEPEGFNTSSRSFFNTLTHEMTHALGVIYSSIQNWINPETGKAYGENLPIKSYKDQNSSKVFHILQSPASHRFAADRFGVEYFRDGIYAGIELEDGGGEGTELSHPESRVYLDDSFSGVTVGQTRITNLTFALLEDTGWYEIDHKLAEYSAWGVGESFGSSKLSDFPLSPPTISYPKHYLCQPDESEVCSFDLLAGAGCRGSHVDCSFISNENEREFCENRNFTDPLGLEMMGPTQAHDFMPYKSPYTDVRCNDITNNGKSTVEQGGELYGGESLCAMSTLSRGYLSFYTSPHGSCYRMTCNDEGELTIHVDDKSKKCSKKGESLNFFGFTGSITCPDPVIACGIRKLYGTLGPVPIDIPKTAGMTTYEIWIAIFSVIGVVVLAIIIFMAIRCIKQKQQSKKESNIPAISKQPLYVEPGAAVQAIQA